MLTVQKPGRALHLNRDPRVPGSCFFHCQVQVPPGGGCLILYDFSKAARCSDQKTGFSGNLSSATLHLCDAFELWFPYLQSRKKKNTSSLRLLYRLKETMLKKHKARDRGGVPCWWPWERVVMDLSISAQDGVGVRDPLRSFPLCRAMPIGS